MFKTNPFYVLLIGWCWLIPLVLFVLPEGSVVLPFLMGLIGYFITGIIVDLVLE